MTPATETLRDGSHVVIRPLRPEDGALYPDFLADVTPDDLRLRFFAPVAELSEAMIDRLTHYNPATAMAFIALSVPGGRMLGVVRLHDDTDGASGSRSASKGAEFAVLVRSSLKGQGLGWLLMKRMIGYARKHGIAVVHGQVLDENSTMLAMCEELGFHVADDPAERGMKYVTLALN
ncbi:MAG: N-acetyltransferase family protein [Pseudolabrys sp.]